MSDRRISVKRVVSIIQTRLFACEEARARHRAEGDHHLAASENCAALELRHIINLIEATQPKDPQHAR